MVSQPRHLYLNRIMSSQLCIKSLKTWIYSCLYHMEWNARKIAFDLNWTLESWFCQTFLNDWISCFLLQIVSSWEFHFFLFHFITSFLFYFAGSSHLNRNSVYTETLKGSHAKPTVQPAIQCGTKSWTNNIVVALTILLHVL